MTLRVPLAVLTLLAGCSSGKAPPKQQSVQTVRSVTVGQVESRPISGSITASGLLVSREEAAVGPQVSGYRVLQVFVDEGDLVRVGQPLARLDPTLIEAKLAQARAAVSEARARAAQASGEAKRVQGLDGSGILADEQIASRRFQADSAFASVEVARAQLRDLETQRAQMIIRAPAAGVILQRTVRPGDVAGAGGEPMFRLVRGRLVELDAELPEDTLEGLSRDASVRVTLPSGGALDGKVRFISPRVDPQTKLGRVRVALPVDRRLRPGGFARATLERAAAPISAVPESAVQFEASGPLVVMIDGHDKARRVAVRTGARAKGWVALVQGPPIGTRVALGGGSFLLDGDPVRVAQER